MAAHSSPSFLHCIMRDGKKSTAESILYDALDIIGEKGNEPSLKLFEQAVDNVRPLIEVKSRRVGRVNLSGFQPKYDHPAEPPWAFDGLLPMPASGPKKEWPISLLPSYWMQPKAEAASVKKKEDTHKMAEANKAFAHFSLVGHVIDTCQVTIEDRYNWLSSMFIIQFD